MNSLLLIVPIAAGAFVATNLDNLALLAAFLVRFRHRTLAVAAAYITSALILALAGYGVGRAAEIAPVEYLGWLGLVPLCLGIAGVVNLYRDNTPLHNTDEGESGGSRIAFVATLTSQLGNGADTILTFGALFADSNPASDSLIAVTVLAMAVIFLAGTRYAVGHPALRKSIENCAPRITPFLLIIVGLYILVDTATDVML
jgi:cadmium resistance protein CadD (predicted permease)